MYWYSFSKSQVLSKIDKSKWKQSMTPKLCNIYQTKYEMLP